MKGGAIVPDFFFGFGHFPTMNWCFFALSDIRWSESAGTFKAAEADKAGKEVWDLDVEINDQA